MNFTDWTLVSKKKNGRERENTQNGYCGEPARPPEHHATPADDPAKNISRLVAANTTPPYDSFSPTPERDTPSAWSGKTAFGTIKIKTNGQFKVYP